MYEYSKADLLKLSVQHYSWMFICVVFCRYRLALSRVQAPWPIFSTQKSEARYNLYVSLLVYISVIHHYDINIALRTFIISS